MNTYPEYMDDDYKRIEDKQIISSLLFGNRFKADQTLYEYLIEFLLVFASPKDANLEDGKMHFHNNDEGSKLSYWVMPRMALRRFVFYDKSRKKGTIPQDEKAYKEMIDILVKKMDDVNDEAAREYIESIQDLFHGYAVVIKNRFWGAQALMPLCPEFILCGADPNEKYRRANVDFTNKPETVDSSFSFDRRNFLARGGELYYLHLLQALDKDKNAKTALEDLLNDLVGVQCKKISDLACFIQDSWEEQYCMDKQKLSQKLSLSFIPQDAYGDCGVYSVKELVNYLSCKLHPINRMDVLAKGVMLQIMRMMSYRVSTYLRGEKPIWIIDMRNESSDTVKKLASDSYKKMENDFMTALNKMARDIHIDDDNIMKVVRDARVDSFDIFKSKGKEMQCIIPVNGPFERMSLSEDVIRFLVLAIVKPGEKMTLNMFLSKLFEHYGIVIGPEEYKKTLNGKGDFSLANDFSYNVDAFQEFLKSTGFLRELSDATSIVVNPYSSIV